MKTKQLTTIFKKLIGNKFKNIFSIKYYMKTVGAETVNKRINWRVLLRDGSDITYRDLKTLCDELNINRTNVYKIATGRSKPVRKKNIVSVEKIYLDNIHGSV